jgi:NDP-hexose-3-ketoreductase
MGGVTEKDYHKVSYLPLMKMLLLGYSDLARRRILPALQSLGIAVDVASRTAKPEAVQGHTRYADYEQALDETDAGIVYVSTRNHEHAPWAKQALEREFHVIVDKPAGLTLNETHQLLDTAERSGRCLAEALVYAYHPAIAAAQAAFREADSAPVNIVGVFSFPPLAPDNYRNRAEFGGGVLLDLGPYAASMGRVFFNTTPDEVCCSRLTYKDGADTSLCVMTTYAGGRSCVGSFGCTAGYLNRVDLLGPGLVVSLDRVFSLPRDAATELTIRRASVIQAIPVPAADSFALFFSDFFDAVRAGDWRRFLPRMREDALTMERLRKGCRL